MFQLRKYQQESIDATFAWMETNNGNPLIVLPTGAGKSLVLAGIIKQALEGWPKTRILVVTHVKELIEQNHAQMLRMWPECPAGIYSAGVGRRDTEAQVLFCGIQSVYGKAAQLGWADLVIIDEAHLVPRDGFGMYLTLLDDLGSMNNSLRVIGLTATPYRTDSGRLDTGEGSMFSGISYDAGLVQLIKDGYLSRTVAKATKSEIDTEGVHRVGGEFVARELENAAMAGELVNASVREILARGQDRKAWLVFCCGIKHAEAVADELQSNGINVATVFGDTDKAQRSLVVERFKRGDLRCIVNVNVLTTGFDAPHVDLIAVLRPTCSPGLFVQMAGRGFRLAQGKSDCLLLDFGGNFQRHGPLDDIRHKESKGTATGEPPVKKCLRCESFVATAALECPDCGYVFPPREITHDERPAEVEAIAGLAVKKVVETFHVRVYEYRRHQSQKKPLPTLRAIYRTDEQLPQEFSEWVCFEHEGWARTKAERWWRNHGGLDPVPSTVADALDRASELLAPCEVKVKLGGEWPEVVAVTCKLEPGQSEPDAGDAPSTVDYSEIPF